MSLYRIVPDSNNFYTVREFEGGSNQYEKLINKESLKERWEPVKVGIVADGKAGDFLSWGGQIICTERTYKVLNSFLGNAVEFLPLLHEKDSVNYYVLNVVELVPIDLDKADVEKFPVGDSIMFVNRYAFKDDVIKGKLIFNSEQYRARGAIVSEEFKTFVEQNGFEGLKFEQIT